MVLLRVLAAAIATTTAVVATTYSGLSSTYGGPDGVDATTGNCAPMMPLTTATRYHVAMNDPQYNQGLNCGRCVQVKCVDPRCTSNKVMTAQVTDRCPECSYGDLDMTLPLFSELTGFVTDKYKIEWQFVDCDVSGGIQVCAKEGSSKFWLYVQPMNTVTGVKSMSINGGDAPPFLPAFYFMSQTLGVELSSTQIEMTSWSGEVISTTVSLQAGACTQISQQFKKGQSPSDPATPPATKAPTTAPTTAPTAAPTTAPPSTASPTTTKASPTSTQAPDTTTSPTTSTPTTAPPTTAATTTSTPEPTTSEPTSTNEPSVNNRTDTTTSSPSPSPTTATEVIGNNLVDVLETTSSAPVANDVGASSSTTVAPANKIGGSPETVVSVQASVESGSNIGQIFVIAGCCLAFVGAVAFVVYVAKKSRAKYMEEKESDVADGQMTRFGHSETGRHRDSDVVIL
ncbi:hypothetical protein AC1031_001210 [Aphanomyces cochlioides]|nr:hypothetical protein AC1031_001210 [Aphanomyces cochlioides]